MLLVLKVESRLMPLSLGDQYETKLQHRIVCIEIWVKKGKERLKRGSYVHKLINYKET